MWPLRLTSRYMDIWDIDGYSQNSYQHQFIFFCLDVVFNINLNFIYILSGYYQVVELIFSYHIWFTMRGSIIIISERTVSEYNLYSHILGRFAESRGVQAPEQWCLPALPDAARSKEESAGEEQQTHMALSGQRSTPGPAGHQGEVSKSNHVLLLL